MQRIKAPTTASCKKQKSIHVNGVIFHNKLVFYGEELSLCPTPRQEHHPLSALCHCVFSIFAAALHIWRLASPFAT
jgi:hypothetical protein